MGVRVRGARLHHRFEGSAIAPVERLRKQALDAYPDHNLVFALWRDVVLLDSGISVHRSTSSQPRVSYAAATAR